MQEALDTLHLVEENLKENSKTKPLVPVQLIRHREIQLPSGTYLQFSRATKHDAMGMFRIKWAPMQVRKWCALAYFVVKENCYSSKNEHSGFY